MPLFRPRPSHAAAPVRGVEVLTPWQVVQRVCRQLLVVLPVFTAAVLVGTLASWGLAEGIYLLRGRPNHWRNQAVSNASIQTFFYTTPRTGTQWLALEPMGMGGRVDAFLALAERAGWKQAGSGRLKHSLESVSGELVYRVGANDRVVGTVLHLPGVRIREALNIEARLRQGWGVPDASLGQLDPDLVVHGLSVWRRDEVIYVLEFVPIDGELYQVWLEGRHAADPLFAERHPLGGLSPADPRLDAMREALAQPPPPRAANVPPLMPGPFLPAPAPGPRR